MKATMSIQKGDNRNQDMKLYGPPILQGEDACKRAL